MPTINGLCKDHEVLERETIQKLLYVGGLHRSDQHSIRTRRNISLMLDQTMGLIIWKGAGPVGRLPHLLR